MGAARLPAEQPARSRRKPPVRATRIQGVRAAAIASAVVDIVGDRLEDEGIALVVEGVLAVDAARELDDLAAAIDVCRRAKRALAGVPRG